MKGKNNNRTILLAVVLIGLLIIAYKVMFVSTEIDFSAEENMAATARVETLLLQIERINFNTDVLQSDEFKSFKSIETPLPSVPVGKKNPFGGFGSN